MKCNDSSYYVGVTDNCDRRFREHQIGAGARYTKLKGAGQILFRESYSSKALATKREQQLKKRSRAKKHALIEGNVQELHLLSASHDKTL